VDILCPLKAFPRPGSARLNPGSARLNPGSARFNMDGLLLCPRAQGLPDRIGSRINAAAGLAIAIGCISCFCY
jgi:hypothetical protein